MDSSKTKKVGDTFIVTIDGESSMKAVNDWRTRQCFKLKSGDIGRAQGAKQTEKNTYGQSICDKSSLQQLS